jgi:hypothetical protein
LGFDLGRIFVRFDFCEFAVLAQHNCWRDIVFALHCQFGQKLALDFCQSLWSRKKID